MKKILNKKLSYNFNFHIKLTFGLTIYLLLSSIFLLSCTTVKNNSTLKSYDKNLANFKYPYQVSHFKFKSQNQNLKMAYMELNASSPKVVVLLHGKNFSGFYWERIANDLVKKGYRVVIPDQIGFGKSSKPKNYQYSFYNLSLNTKKLLNNLKVKQAIIVGHSMGGMLATHFSYLYPDVVKKIILVNPIGLEPYLQYVEYKDPSFFYNIELNKTAEKVKNYQQKNYYDGKWKAEYNKLIEPTLGQLKGSDWPLIAWNNALTYGPIFSEGITDKFGYINKDIVLIIGTRDKTGPGRNWKKPGVNYKLGQYNQLGKKLSKRYNNIKLYELDGLGHMPQFENYERFKKVFYPHF